MATALSEISRILRALKTVNKKTEASLTLALNGVPHGERAVFMRILNHLNNTASDKSEEDSTESGVASVKKTARVATFLANLKAWANNHQTEAIQLQLEYPELERLLGQEVMNTGHPVDNWTPFVDLYEKLNQTSIKLEELQAAVSYKKAEIVMKMDSVLPRSSIEEKLKCGIDYVPRIKRYYNLCTVFPILKFAPYSYNTLLQYEKDIVSAAEADINFGSLLRTPLTVQYIKRHPGGDLRGELNP